MIKDIDKQVAEWHEAGKNQEIIEALEALPVNALTPARAGLLARAYMHLGTDEDLTPYETALDILDSVRDRVEENDFMWYFRMAAIHYYLYREHEAFPYIDACLQSADTEITSLAQELREDCVKGTTRPNPPQGFYLERVQKVWSTFEQHESELRHLIADAPESKELDALVRNLCAPALCYGISEIDIVEGRLRLILSTFGRRSLLLLYHDFEAAMPESVRSFCEICVGAPADPSGSLQLDTGEHFFLSEVSAYAEKRRKSAGIRLSLYHPDLATLLSSDEAQAADTADTLTTIAIGEPARHAFVGQVEILKQPLADTGIPLSELYAHLVLNFGNADTAANIERTCRQRQSYVCHDFDNECEIPMHTDIEQGEIALPSLVGEYMHDDYATACLLLRAGAVPLYIAFSADSFHLPEEETNHTAFADLIAKLEQHLTTHVAPGGVRILGNALGHAFGYLHLLAYDFHGVGDAAHNFFAESDFDFVALRVFHDKARLLILKDGSQTSEASTCP